MLLREDCWREGIGKGAEIRVELTGSLLLVVKVGLCRTGGERRAEEVEEGEL